MIANNKVIEDGELNNNTSLILSSFISKYHDNLNLKYVKLVDEIANPVIYIFLLPFVSKDNLFIIKLGYTTDLIKRYNQLKKEFDVDEIKLIYSYVLDGEHTELNIHKNLEKNLTTSVYKMNNKLTLISKEHEIKKTDESIKKTEESIKKMELKMSDNQVELKKMELKVKS